LLERLSQRFEHAAAELGQLVEKEHAAVREAQLARPRHAAAADERDVRARVMRRAKGPPANEAAARGKRAGDGMDRRDHQRFVEAQRRQQSRQPSRQHGLARARRTAHEQVMSARRRDLQRAPPQCLATNIGQIVLVLLLVIGKSRPARDVRG
jgi:hypothetical protein